MFFYRVCRIAVILYVNKADWRSTMVNLWGKLSDPLYVLDHAQRTYVPLTPEVQQQLEMGNIRL